MLVHFLRWCFEDLNFRNIWQMLVKYLTFDISLLSNVCSCADTNQDGVRHLVAKALQHPGRPAALPASSNSNSINCNKPFISTQKSLRLDRKMFISNLTWLLSNQIIKQIFCHSVGEVHERGAYWATLERYYSHI